MLEEYDDAGYPVLSSRYEYASVKGEVYLRGNSKLIRLGRDDEKRTLLRFLESMDGSTNLSEISSQLDLPIKVFSPLLTKLVESDIVRIQPSSVSLDSQDSREILLENLRSSGIDALAEISTSNVLIIGTGTLGRAIGRHLASAGVMELKFLDDSTGTVRDRLGTLDAEELVAPSDRSSCARADDVAMPKIQLDRELLTKAISDSDLVIVAAPDCVPFPHDVINAICVAIHVKWFPVRWAPTEVVVGPVFYPPYTACLECYRTRLGSNGPNWRIHKGMDKELSLASRRMSFGELSAWPELAASAAAVVALQILGELNIPTPGLYGNEWFISLVNYRSELNRVFKLPRCHICGVSEQIPEVSPWLLDR